TSTYNFSTYAGTERLIAEDLANMRPVKLATADVTVADGANVNFDFGTGFAPVTHALSGAGITTASASYRDAHGITYLDRSTMPTDFRAVPADKLGSRLNRLYVADATGKYVIRHFKDPVDPQCSMSAALQLSQHATWATT